MRIVYKIATIFAVLGQLSDCVTTQVAISLGAKEANPLMQGLVKHFWLACLVKVGVALIFTGFCYKKHYPRSYGAVMIAIIGVIGFLAAGWNSWNILNYYAYHS
jgi:hypothetical protein